jgi:hypothetical protein
MNSVRFLVQIVNAAAIGAPPAWSVTITRPGSTFRCERALQAAEVAGEGFFPQPPASELPSNAEPHHALCVDVQHAHAVCARIAARLPDPHDITSFGRYLFETLLGAKPWSAIQVEAGAVPMIELALCWSKAERPLHRLNWELLHDGNGFLAKGYRSAGNLVRVALTRVVADTLDTGRPLSLPTRLLCVVGCSLDDERIRPGAELLGLLRQLDKDSRKHSLHTKVVLDASLGDLKQRLEEFRPDIVHLISHGDPNSGNLEFAREEGDDEAGPVRVDAESLADHLTVRDAAVPGGDFRPAIVILSACFSGTVAGPADTAPIAAELVSAGFPVVVGMAGSVADRACRLFTRFFGEALLLERPLVAAVERGRRAAFTNGESPESSADWAYPTIFLASEVTSDYAPTSKLDAGREKSLHHALGVLGLRARDNEPVLAARYDILDGVYRDLMGGVKPVLTIIGEEDTGKTRLLRELAAQALRDGHLPMVIISDRSKQSGFTPEQLRSDLLFGLAASRAAFQLKPNGQSQLESLRPPLDPNAPPALLAPEVVQRLSFDRELSAGVLAIALRHDLEQLLSEIKAAGSPLLSTNARPVVLLDEIQTLPAAFLTDLFADDVRRVLGAFGLGDSDDRRIPVVFTFHWSTPAYDALRPIAEGSHASWMRVTKLDPFTDGEDLRAYSRVLLHVHDRKLYAQVSDRAWVIDWNRASPAKLDERIRRLRKRLRRQPGDFIERRLYEWVEDSDGCLKLADDNDALKELG